MLGVGIQAAAHLCISWCPRKSQVLVWITTNDLQTQMSSTSHLWGKLPTERQVTTSSTQVRYRQL